MLPITQIPASRLDALKDYRELFEAGFEHVRRYITGLIVSSNKTLQGIHDLQVGSDGKSNLIDTSPISVTVRSGLN